MAAGPHKVDWGKVAVFDLGGRASVDHDEILYRGFLEDMAKREAEEPR